MNLSKRQVKALLDIMSDDKTRPAICQAWIDKRGDKQVLVTTDGYHLVVLNTELGPRHVGKVVTRDELVKWYKLATAKDVLTNGRLADMLTEPEHNYPRWEQLIPTEPEQLSTFTLNARYLTNLETVNGQPLTYKSYGRLRPFVAENENGLFVIMPIKD